MDELSSYLYRQRYLYKDISLEKEVWNDEQNFHYAFLGGDFRFLLHNCKFLENFPNAFNRHNQKGQSICSTNTCNYRNVYLQLRSCKCRYSKVMLKMIF